MQASIQKTKNPHVSISFRESRLRADASGSTSQAKRVCEWGLRQAVGRWQNRNLFHIARCAAGPRCTAQTQSSIAFRAMIW